MQAERLIQNMVDQLIELQVKLGYARETVRLYYPVTSLAGILGVDPPAEKEAFRDFLTGLNESPALQKTPLGPLIFAGNRTRMSVSIPPGGSEYVHEHHAASAFLVELIDLFQHHHHCSLEEVEAVFARHGAGGYLCEKMPPGADFDYVLHLNDPAIDEYYYCIKMEMGHTIYHRFMREDYEALL